MMSANKNELKNLSKKDELVKEVSDKMFILNDDDTITRTITPEEDARMYLESEKYYARKEGLKEGITNVAISMLEKNMSIKDISEITKLSRKEIDELKNKLNKEN